MMTRDELVQSMDRIEKLMAKRDDADHGSSEEEELGQQVFAEGVRVLRHVILCLHDIAHNTSGGARG